MLDGTAYYGTVIIQAEKRKFLSTAATNYNTRFTPKVGVGISTPDQVNVIWGASSVLQVLRIVSSHRLISGNDKYLPKLLSIHPFFGQLHRCVFGCGRCEPVVAVALPASSCGWSRLS